jgi:transcriptional regulator with XRE-family HTH domain
MTAGELLRTVRRRHGLSQAQLAARARTSQAAISRIERGQVSPSVATLTTLLDLIGEELALDATPIDYGTTGRSSARTSNGAQLNAWRTG